ncbi:alanine racemase [Zymomonas mobilis subsp. mobilis ZM4 = ATCC 31821]|uniref:Alanine racemase n=1 Tax=Zymomonas mobilis subsp. mobilis (strain ATCC 31821 / ZM4 / CP4) TaxID=264203 RepID=Q5NM44_ZYMMO|nr:alanine racemase [Zymomonas mobilis]AAV90216.1 alanine racemase [Zymomonas mobilis subsp. mobilis ZM4 = ATCC 31821]ACV76155.1 alanine racemase [Zymomonas mobilis subsp. mobilis NCIMB 11163]AVZ26419.1 alanine racemase [Zymomonas mobilis subsp. mobilis]AVZ28306.1 alanine racemase [Zymomonas mobilis subsp. mobilis]AVZ42751.1 alanine racemase [Zymomonas mobilis subsp. mobilis ZM4 = ATCC 31821]
MQISSPLRLELDKSALMANWQSLNRITAGHCGAAIKANGYGLGAERVRHYLAQAGCRDFFVSSWDEARLLDSSEKDFSLSVLHGLREDDLGYALNSSVKPVLCSPAMIARWKAHAPNRPCDVMVDTGMNRLGLSMEEAGSGLLDGLSIDNILSHLACADEADHPLNQKQLERFRILAARKQAKRYSLANSAGIFLSKDYHFDLARPGLALYGGLPVPQSKDILKPVVAIAAQAIQVREVSAGEAIGYGACFVTPKKMRVAILHVGYADGYWRAFFEKGHARKDGVICPLAGRVSMDMITVALPDVLTAHEGDWFSVDFDLPSASQQTGLSQYELLTGLGHRYQSVWQAI